MEPPSKTHLKIACRGGPMAKMRFHSYGWAVARVCTDSHGRTRMRNARWGAVGLDWAWVCGPERVLL